MQSFQLNSYGMTWIWKSQSYLLSENSRIASTSHALAEKKVIIRYVHLISWKPETGRNYCYHKSKESLENLLQKDDLQASKDRKILITLITLRFFRGTVWGALMSLCRRDASWLASSQNTLFQSILSWGFHSEAAFNWSESCRSA